VGELVGIVLGAGSSVRMGRPKQLLALGTSTVLGRSVAAATAATLDRVLVVVPRSIPEVGQALPAGRAETVTLDDMPVPPPDDDLSDGAHAHRPGCSSSLQAGLARADEADAVVLLLGDMPTLPTTVIDQVIADWRDRRPWAAVTAYRDGIGHPFVFSADAFATLRGLHGDKAVWKVVEHEPPERIRRIPIDTPRPPDVDTWEDYLDVCRRLDVLPIERT